MEVTLDQHGRIVVPKPFRDRLGVEAETDLTVTVERGRLVLEPVPMRVVLEEREGLLGSTGAVPQDVDVERVMSEIRTERHRKKAGLDTEGATTPHGRSRRSARHLGARTRPGERVAGSP